MSARGASIAAAYCHCVAPDREQHRNDRRPEKQADEAERFQPAENAKQHPEKWDSGRAADQDRTDEMVRNEHDYATEDQDQNAGGHLRLTDKRERRNAEDERRAERNRGEHAGGARKQKRML